MPSKLFRSKPPPAKFGALSGKLYTPPANSFIPATADIYSNTHGTYPVVGPKRAAAVPCMIAGNWLAGHRTDVLSTDVHSHYILFDPTIEIRDAYAGNGQALGANADAIVINGLNWGQNLSISPWLFVTFSGISFFPGIGKRKEVLCDQYSSYPASTYLKDTFSDANSTALAAHIMDLGGGWTSILGGTMIITGNQATNDASGAANKYSSNAGSADFSQASLDIKADTNYSGLMFRASDASNHLSCRLVMGTLSLIKRVAGIETTLASQAISLTQGTIHTVNVTASGSSLTANVDGGTNITATESFNSTITKHGLEMQGGIQQYVDNFQVSK